MFLHRTEAEGSGRRRDRSRLTLLAAPPRTASQCLFPALLGLPLVPRSVIEVIGFHGALQLALHLVGHGGIAQPPTPAIARPAMHPQLSRNTSRRAREAQQEGGENPVGQRSFALVEQRIGEIIERILRLEMRQLIDSKRQHRKA